MRITKIYLENVKEMIRANNLEEVKMWCKEKRLDIHNEGFGDFVLDYQLEFAMDSIYISKLIAEYRNDWYEYYEKVRECRVLVPKSEIMEITYTYPLIKATDISVKKASTSLFSTTNKQVFTIKEAANYIGCTDKHIRNCIQRGHLEAEPVNRSEHRKNWRITQKALDKFISDNKTRAWANRKKAA